MRLVFIAVAFLASSAIAYLFIDKVVNFIVAPLGKSIQLVYLSPGGAFNFLIQACLYVGVLGALPVIVYQIYRFVMPAVATVGLRRALTFTILSCLLAAGGVVFAYVVALPAALYFLTNFNLYHINPMLTIDAYFSFVMTYLVMGAVLFQLPLIMLIINSVRPLTPGGLMKAQPHIILGSFIVAAIVSPTPDAVNQTLLASPIVVMYQAGILAIWAINRRARRTTTPSRQSLKKQPKLAPLATTSLKITPATHTSAAKHPAPTPRVAQAHMREPTQLRRAAANRRSIDGMSGPVVNHQSSPLSTRHGNPPQHLSTKAHLTTPSQQRVAQSLDGFLRG